MRVRALQSVCCLSTAKTLDKFLRPFVLDDCPPVLSVGQRVEHDGFSCMWHHGSPPVLGSPEGQRIELTVQNHVPYLMEETRVDSAYVAHCEQAATTPQLASGNARAWGGGPLAASVGALPRVAQGRVMTNCLSLARARTCLTAPAERVTRCWRVPVDPSPMHGGRSGPHGSRNHLAT